MDEGSGRKVQNYPFCNFMNISEWHFWTWNFWKSLDENILSDPWVVFNVSFSNGFYLNFDGDFILQKINNFSKITIDKLR